MSKRKQEEIAEFFETFYPALFGVDSPADSSVLDLETTAGSNRPSVSNSEWLAFPGYRVDDEEKLSPCCGAPIYEDTDICTACKEHC